ncbi:hypothetical protein PUN28_003291 [Cardiocondyla obscurior]|uniref:Uncharacterized protein n=1 Tax=Cardiocondyla obscurior TaxID=286306 RepID=A0AAW2GMY8_9HYME
MLAIKMKTGYTAARARMATLYPSEEQTWPLTRKRSAFSLSSCSFILANVSIDYNATVNRRRHQKRD